MGQSEQHRGRRRRPRQQWQRDLPVHQQPVSAGDDNDSFKILAITVETQPPVVITTESVPVPGTVLLLGSALLGMGGLRRARRQA